MANSQATFESLVIVCLSSALGSRRFTAKTGLWNLAIVVATTTLVFAGCFVAFHLATSSAMSSAIATVPFAGAFAALLTALLLFPGSTYLQNQLDSANRRSSIVRENLVELRGELTDLNQQISSTTGMAQAVSDQVARDEHTRSLRHQRQRLFDRNWRAMRGVELEQYLEEVFTLLGYAVEATRTTGDQGIDLIVVRGNLRIAIQVKGYFNSVGNAAIQEAYAGMAHYKCHRCAVITNSRFTSGAVELAKSTRCLLIHEDNFRAFVFGEIDLTAESGYPT